MLDRAGLQRFHAWGSSDQRHPAKEDNSYVLGDELWVRLYRYHRL